MGDAGNQTVQIQGWVQRLREGDTLAREELFACACDRLRRLTHRMLRSFPRVQRWEETDDVFQGATLRLCKALDDVQLNDATHFLRLAAQQIRRELIDLSRHWYGAQGAGAHHYTHVPGEQDDGRAGPHEGIESTYDPDKLARWAEFHRLVGELPDEEREVFDLLWYHELPQQDAAKLLDVSDRTVKRRWQSARLKLHQVLKDSVAEVPDDAG